MKRILGIIALALVMGMAFVGCNNRPPFEKLAAAVDSMNTELMMAPIGGAASASVKYDEITNTVKYTLNVPGIVDKATMDEAADRLADSFVEQMALFNGNLFDEIVAAKANVLLDFEGSMEGKYELLIENKAFAALTRQQPAEAEQAAEAEQPAE